MAAVGADRFHPRGHRTGPAVMRGGSIVKLQTILGHAGVRTTPIYARLAPDHLIGATAILEGLGAAQPAEISTTSAHGAPATRPTLARRV